MTDLTLAFAGAARAATALRNATAFCIGLSRVLGGGESNCTEAVRMDTYRFTTQPGAPGRLALVHVSSTRPVDDALFQATANLTAALQQSAFLPAGARVVLIARHATQSDEVMTVAVVCVLLMVAVVCTRFARRAEAAPYTIAPQEEASEEKT